MIVLGHRSGEDDERHYKIEVECSCGKCSEDLCFDVYAETPDEAVDMIQEYFHTVYHILEVTLR